MNFPAWRWAKAGAVAFVDLLYPVICVYCLGAVEGGQALCAQCAGKTPAITAPFCAMCSQPFDGQIDGDFVCSNCEDRGFAFECAVSAYRSTGLVRELIHRFKYRDQYHLRRVLGGLLLKTMDDERILDRTAHALVPVPLHARRLRDRGFNQAEALCRVLSRATALPVWHALRRTRHTETQTHFSRAERKRNLVGAFVARPGCPVAGKDLLLVDDVFTTGSTVHECARVLRKAGAASVRVLTVARG